MRDPLSWAFTIFRAFGVPVKVHILFIVVTLGLFLRQITLPNNPIVWTDALLFMVVLLFGIVLLHEFGHVFGARHVEGDAREVVLWPLGGLAALDVPRTPYAHFVATAAGPAVNLVICLLCAAGLAIGGFFPNLNPLSNPYVSEIKNYRDGRIYTSQYGLRLYAADGSGETRAAEGTWKPEVAQQAAVRLGGERTIAPAWAVWLNRTFYLSWLLFLFNLLPAYPLDGGRLLQCAIWVRSDYQRGLTVAAYSGYICGAVFLIAAIAVNEALLLGLGLFMLFESWRSLHVWETEEAGPFGYDFSAGYTSLEKGEEEPRPKRQSWWARWRARRAARRLQRELEQRAREEARLDELLDKIARYGKDSLTPEERRFLEQMSARKRHLS